MAIPHLHLPLSPSRRTDYEGGPNLPQGQYPQRWYRPLKRDLWRDLWYSRHGSFHRRLDPLGLLHRTLWAEASTLLSSVHLQHPLRCVSTLRYLPASGAWMARYGDYLRILQLRLWVRRYHPLHDAADSPWPVPDGALCLRQ